MSGDELGNKAIVTAFIAAWSELDVDKLVDYFTQDGTYHNMPTRPVSGRSNLKQFISGFIANWDKTDWEVISVMADGDLVAVERVDRTVVGDKTVELPCFGIFEMREGKIAVWRDYFDMGTFMKALA